MMLQGPGAFGPFTSTEALAVATAALLVAVALAIVADPVAGIVWLLTTAPGVYVVTRSVLLGRDQAARRIDGGRAGRFGGRG